MNAVNPVVAIGDDILDCLSRLPRNADLIFKTASGEGALFRMLRMVRSESSARSAQMAAWGRNSLARSTGQGTTERPCLSGIQASSSSRFQAKSIISA